MQTKQLSRSVAEGTGEVRGELEGSRNVLQDCKTSCWWWCSQRRRDEATRRLRMCHVKNCHKIMKMYAKLCPRHGQRMRGGYQESGGGEGNQLSRDWLAKVFSEKFCVRSLLCPGADDSRRSCTVASKEGEHLMEIWVGTRGNLTGSLGLNVVVFLFKLICYL